MHQSQSTGIEEWQMYKELLQSKKCKAHIIVMMNMIQKSKFIMMNFNYELRVDISSQSGVDEWMNKTIYNIYYYKQQCFCYIVVENNNNNNNN